MQIQEEQKQNTEKKEKIRYSFLIPIIIHQFLMAAVTANISFQTYIISYLYHYESDLDQNKSYFLTPCFILGSYLFAFLGGILEKKLGLKLSIIIADSIVFFGDALMLCTKLYGIYYVCFIIFGMGYSLSIILLTKIVCKDSSKKGIMNGILSIGTALGASLYNLVGEFAFINPSGKETTIKDQFYEFDIANNYKKYIILEEFSILASIGIVIFFFKNNSSVIYQIEDDNIINLKGKENGNNEDNENNERNSDNNNDILSFELKEKKENLINKEYKTEYIKKAFSNFRVWKLFILYFLCSFVYNAVNTMYRNIAIRKNISTTIVQILSIIGFIIGCFCSFLWGYLIQKYSFKLLISIINIAGVILGFSFYFSLGSSFFFALFVTLQQIFSCGILVILNIHIMNVYKMEYYVEIFGVVSFAYGISLIASSAFSYLIENYLSDINLAYAIIFCVGGGFSLVSTFIGFFEGENKFEIE